MMKIDRTKTKNLIIDYLKKNRIDFGFLIKQVENFPESHCFEQIVLHYIEKHQVLLDYKKPLRFIKAIMLIFEDYQRQFILLVINSNLKRLFLKQFKQQSLSNQNTICVWKQTKSDFELLIPHSS